MALSKSISHDPARTMIGSFGNALRLIVTFAGCWVVAHGFYELLAQTLKQHLSSARWRQNVNRVFGASFIGLGLSLFTLKGRAA